MQLFHVPGLWYGLEMSQPGSGQAGEPDDRRQYPRSLSFHPVNIGSRATPDNRLFVADDL